MRLLSRSHHPSFAAPRAAVAASVAAAIVLVVVMLPAGAGTAAAQEAAPPDAWTQFRGTAGLTGVSSSTVPENPRLLWSFEAGESIDSSAAIVDGTVYVGTYTGELVALDLETGDLKWRYQASERMGIGESSPAVGHGMVFVGDLAGVLHAVDAETGAEVWTYATQGEIKSSPVLSGDRVLIGSYDGYLYGLEVATGELAWQVETQNYVHATPAVTDGVAWFGGCDETFHGVRISDGTEITSVPAGAYTAASSAIRDGHAYFGTFDNEVVSLDLSTGDIVWRYEHPRRHFPFYSSALNVDGTVVIGGRDRMVHGIDAGTGEMRWTFMTRARVDSSPAAAGGRVYIGSGDGRFYILDLDSGEKLWEFDTGAPLSASPAIADGKDGDRLAGRGALLLRVTAGGELPCPCENRSMSGAPDRRHGERRGERAGNYANVKMRAGGERQVREQNRAHRVYPGCHLRATVGAVLENVDFDLQPERVDDPALRNAVPREHAHLATTVDGCRRGREHFDGDVRRRARHRVRPHQVAPFSPEEDNVGLHDVVLVQHEVERRGQCDAARPAPVVAQQRDELGDRDLVARQRRRNHDECSAVDLVPAPVVRHDQEVAVAEARLHVPAWAPSYHRLSDAKRVPAEAPGSREESRVAPRAAVPPPSARCGNVARFAMLPRFPRRCLAFLLLVAAGFGSFALSAEAAGRPFAGIVDAAARRHGVDPDLVHAVIAAESGYRASAQSPAGAQGLMQLMPGTQQELGVSDAFDPRQNVDAGVAYLRRLTDEVGTVLALAAYNAGARRRAALRRHAAIQGDARLRTLRSRPQPAGGRWTGSRGP